MAGFTKSTTATARAAEQMAKPALATDLNQNSIMQAIFERLEGMQRMNEILQAQVV